jgi:UDP-N-acetylmuramate--alanine ligase
MVVLMDIYAAGEPPIPGITGQALADAIRAAGHKSVVFHSSMQKGIEELLRAARPGDAILTIGAGNVSRAPGELAVLLGARVSLHHAH